jgi:hypothetical protein
VITKTVSPKPDYVRVVFELPASLWADHVALVGDFNHWDPAATPFRQGRDGVWRAVVDLCLGNTYEFRYLIDGRWSTDYHADGAAPNPHGSLNSVVRADPPARQPDHGLNSSMVRERPLPKPGQTATPVGAPAMTCSQDPPRPASEPAAEPEDQGNGAPQLQPAAKTTPIPHRELLPVPA